MPDRALAQPTSATSGVLRGIVRRWHLGVLAVAALGFAVPVALLTHGTERARACLASIAAPRGPELPDCRREIRWLVFPSRVPWTAVAARYRAEELSLRASIAAYEDATVGRPDGAAQSRAAADLAAAAGVVRAGSQRIALEELGPAVGAPDPGQSALLAGDRRTLVGRADAWEHWTVRLRALEAALLEGDDAEHPGRRPSASPDGPASAPPSSVPPGAGPMPARAAALARRYAEFDPRDEELRVAVAAALCLQGDARRGVELLTTVQAERARDRHEAWARNWGEVRALIVACAARTGAPPPATPMTTDAGVGDALPARAVLRLRQVGQRDPGDSPALRAAAFEVIEMLKGSALAPGVRVRLLAALLASGHDIDENLAAALAAPHVADGEAPLREPALTAIDWLDEPRGVRPSPSRQALRHAADRLLRLSESPEISPGERLSLEAAETATVIEAARDFALAGDAPGAVEVIDRAGPRALPSASARALLRSSAFYVAAEPARALAELDREPPDLRDDPTVQAAWWIQKAELLASAGRRDEAARAAVTADDMASQRSERGLAVRAQWTRAALARLPLPALRAEPPRPLPGARVWPWVGEIATPSSWLVPDAESPAAVARALGLWDAARRAPAEEQRALRYAAATAHRGDAPRAYTAYLALAAQILPEGEGDVEVWLDAFSATSSRKLTMRAYAWARAEAARFRGDADAASRWTGRYRTLVRLAAPPDDAELTGALGI